jgi:hydrogenase maturation protein HypF
MRGDGAVAMAAAPRQACRVTVTGRVQGVGFRPFVYRIATRHGLTGSVRNVAGRVEIEVCGETQALGAFLAALVDEAPPLALPHVERVAPAPPVAHGAFTIEASLAPGLSDVHLPADSFVCPACLAEMSDPRDRRYRHPFINCTQCGPRYTIIRGLPYDRPRTSMAAFAMCPRCRAEYEDPADRRFHAEPIACPECGPQLVFVDAARRIESTPTALEACVDALRRGAIVAAKGIGGYHLLCDALDAHAVERLRARKARPHKPLAVLFPLAGPDGLDAVRRRLVVDAATATALIDATRPIVLARRQAHCDLADTIAPGLDEVGALLPYSPLHALLAADFGGPLVATSGNLSGEPVLTDAPQATRRLAHIADAFLHHDRPIERPADDAVLRVSAGRARPLRLGRGSAPLELRLGAKLDRPVLALGGHGKVTVALAFDDRVVLSPHIGDLDSPRGRDVFALVGADLQRLYGVQARTLLVDPHPGYASTRWARQSGLAVFEVLHHHAHASAAAFERPGVADWLCLAWDGVGLGENHALWGGEALVGAPGRWRHAGSWRAFRLPGGERAAREPWRSAAALCWETETAFTPPVAAGELARSAWRAGVNAPLTSSVGRLFDAAAALILGIEGVSFEAQAALRLEAVAANAGAGQAIVLPMHDDARGILRIDWAPLLAHLRDRSCEAGRRAADFHATLVDAGVRQALALRERFRFAAVALTGGVFQNRLLCEAFVAAGARRGLEIVVPERTPLNDAGLAFGQVVEYGACHAPGEGPR